MVTKLIQPITPTESRKLSPVIEKAEVDLIPVGITNSKYLFISFIFMIAMSVVVMRAQMLIDRKNDKKLIPVRTERNRIELTEDRQGTPSSSIRSSEGTNRVR